MSAHLIMFCAAVLAFSTYWSWTQRQENSALVRVVTARMMRYSRAGPLLARSRLMCVNYFSLSVLGCLVLFLIYRVGEFKW